MTTTMILPLVDFTLFTFFRDFPNVVTPALQTWFYNENKNKNLYENVLNKTQGYFAIQSLNKETCFTTFITVYTTKCISNFSKAFGSWGCI
jgi:hypothetical protein